MKKIIPILKRKFFYKFPVPATDDFGAPIIDEFIVGIVKVSSRPAMLLRQDPRGFTGRDLVDL